MRVNEGMFDRVLRMVVGVGLLTLTQMNYIGAWGYIGAIPLLTGAVGYCPLYQFFGFQTCPIKSIK